VVTCPLAPSVPHLLSGSYSSPRAFGLGFLQTPPRDDALALLLSFGSAKTWYEDFHLASSVPCPAHTLAITRERREAPAIGFMALLDDIGRGPRLCQFPHSRSVQLLLKFSADSRGQGCQGKSLSGSRGSESRRASSRAHSPRIPAKAKVQQQIQAADG